MHLIAPNAATTTNKARLDELLSTFAGAPATFYLGAATAAGISGEFIDQSAERSGRADPRKWWPQTATSTAAATAIMDPIALGHANLGARAQEAPFYQSAAAAAKLLAG